MSATKIFYSEREVINLISFVLPFWLLGHHSCSELLHHVCLKSCSNVLDNRHRINFTWGDKTNIYNKLLSFLFLFITIISFKVKVTHNISPKSGRTSIVFQSRALLSSSSHPQYQRALITMLKLHIYV